MNTLPRAILQCLLNFIELIISLEDIEFFKCGGFEPNWLLSKHYKGKHLYFGGSTIAFPRFATFYLLLISEFAAINIIFSKT